MYKYKMNYKLLAVWLLCFALCRCADTGHFVVKGVVAGAGGQILYLENTGLTSITMLDSVILKPNGKFAFKEKSPQYPDFYRLRLNNQLIHFAVDSSDVISFTADAHNFSTAYTVEGSESSKALKVITLAQLDANQAVKKLRDNYGMNLLPDSTYQASIINAVNTYKETVKQYIYGAPSSPAAYFALFQQIDGLWFYDLYDRTDSKAYGAVATNYKMWYPGSPRAKQLESLALQSLKVIRGERQRASGALDGIAKEVSYIDVELPDIHDRQIKLSANIPGKAVLVNFTAYQTDWSPAFNLTLGDIYGKYHDKGLEIYQVSLDNDAHFWKNAASNIPWVSVRDPLSVNSTYAALYNVRQLPALFLINKKGELVKRIESVETIEKDIKAVL